MKAILEFDMYEDAEAFEIYYKALDYLQVIQDFDKYLNTDSVDGAEAVDKETLRAVWQHIKKGNLE